MEKISTIKSLENLLVKINPLQRMINSDGLNKSYEIIKSEIPELKLHEYKSGEKAEDWEVPKNWKVNLGFMKDKNNNIIASIDDSLLFVAPYSEGVKGWFSKKEIEKHLMTRKDRPDDFLLQHRNAYDYNLKTWGITLPYRIWENLKDSEYYIEIDVTFKNDTMKVGEIFVKGQSDKIICFTAHIDELCNDDLSACVVGIEFFKYLKMQKDLKYSYQLLLFPELFGPIFYLHNNPKIIQKYLGMINLETVGAGEKLCIKKSINKNSYLENIMRLTINNLKLNFKELDFFQGYLNDEKIFSWPNVGIDSIALQRYPFYQYHTSADNLDVINYDYLFEIIEILETFHNIIEFDYIPKFNGLFPPWLTKRNLYFDTKERPDLNKNKFNNHLLYFIDGKTNLSQICSKYNLDFIEASNYLDQFLKQKIIKK